MLRDFFNFQNFETPTVSVILSATDGIFPLKLRRKILRRIVLVRRKGFSTSHILMPSVDQKFRRKIHVLTEKFAFSVENSIRIMIFLLEKLALIIMTFHFGFSPFL